MRARLFRWAVLTLAVLAGTGVLLLPVAGCGGKKEKATTGVTDIDEIWGQIEEANRDITSVHREIAIYYENTQFGGGQVSSMITDSSGEDVHDQTLILNQVVSEAKYVNGRHYERDATTDNVWKEVPVVSGDASTEYTPPRLLDRLSRASSKEYIGTEMIGDQETDHWRFSMQPEFATAMFPSQPPSDFSQNTGSVVDLWIGEENYYIARCEIVIDNVLITNEIGTGDLRFVINFSKINQPIEITPPI